MSECCRKQLPVLLVIGSIFLATRMEDVAEERLHASWIAAEIAVTLSSPTLMQSVCLQTVSHYQR